ncbi:hypothetical protein SAMN04488598_1458 [Halanaerobium congolense]|uniref:Uncharacterized protein n=1 Tax=Halanaerobium congolense TaxID=54121 RepID=A0A1I0CH99_9FIRM|nr:hypothetical protein [Halanaerobium congolense]PTX14836.1 hypothetical protein C7953_2902 [Halanaerobium congolense]SDG08718.1 hypothetical protein SAMN04488598_1458 [Halanaerobium congolense]SET19001.1 hypothetical protein SAMN04515652_1378 [Halanaerobium congolense]SFP80348.1 hypothetical protein SAMN04488596_1674 [Halanaerobium congolense]
MKKTLILIFVLLVLLSSSALANEATFIDDVEWGMNKSKVIENTDLQIINSNTEKREGTSYTTLVYNGEFVGSRGNYQLFFVNDQLYSITRFLLTEEEDIAENYYQKWRIDLKENKINHSKNNLEENTGKGVKQTLLENSRYDGNLFWIDLNKADLSKFNINKNNIPEVFEYMIINDISNNTILLNATM